MAGMQRSNPTLFVAVLALIGFELLGRASGVVSGGSTSAEIVVALELVVLVFALAEDNNALAALVAFLLLFSLVGLISDIGSSGLQSDDAQVRAVVTRFDREVGAGKLEACSLAMDPVRRECAQGQALLNQAKPASLTIASVAFSLEEATVTYVGAGYKQTLRRENGKWLISSEGLS
jgi:hypothetical protein